MGDAQLDLMYLGCAYKPKRAPEWESSHLYAKCEAKRGSILTRGPSSKTDASLLTSRCRLHSAYVCRHLILRTCSCMFFCRLVMLVQNTACLSARPGRETKSRRIRSIRGAD